MGNMRGVSHGTPRCCAVPMEQVMHGIGLKVGGRVGETGQPGPEVCARVTTRQWDMNVFMDAAGLVGKGSCWRTGGYQPYPRRA